MPDMSCEINAGDKNVIQDLIKKAYNMFLSGQWWWGGAGKEGGQKRVVLDQDGFHICMAINIGRGPYISVSKEDNGIRQFYVRYGKEINRSYRIDGSPEYLNKELVEEYINNLYTLFTLKLI